jgi:3-polyprenyl-4-hydroxybenzoate decarboxylase
MAWYRERGTTKDEIQARKKDPMLPIKIAIGIPVAFWLIASLVGVYRALHQ